MDVRLLREIFRNLSQWEALFEDEGIDTIIGPDGVTYCLHDIKRIYEARFLLSLRQSQAIAMFLVSDLRERSVASGLGVSEANPVAIYATQGLLRLCQMYDTGILPGSEDSYDGDAVGAAEAEAWRVPAAGRGG